MNSQAYSLQIATLLPENQKTFFDNIEDLLEQADEVDKKYLQYEGGVGVTSLALEGIFDLAASFKQFPAKLDQQRLAKFLNYLLSKRHPTNVRTSFFVLRAVLKLTDNQVTPFFFKLLLITSWYFKMHLIFYSSSMFQSFSTVCLKFLSLHHNQTCW